MGASPGWSLQGPALPFITHLLVPRVVRGLCGNTGEESLWGKEEKAGRRLWGQNALELPAKDAAEEDVGATPPAPLSGPGFV